MTKSFIKCFIFLFMLLNIKIDAQSNNSEYYLLLNKDNISVKDFFDTKFPYPYSNNVFQPINKMSNKTEINNIRMDSLIAASLSGSRSKHSFVYNQKGKLSEWLVQYNTGTEWVNSYLNTYTYDSNDNLIIETQFDWNTSKWDSSSRTVYYYNDLGNITQYVYQTFTGNNWLNSSNMTYKYYNASGEIDTAILETWINNQWQKSELINYFYSEQNRKDSILFFIWNGSGWQYDMKTNFYYNNSSTSPDSMLATYWGGGDLWMNLVKSININDSNNNIIEQTDQTWQAFYWRNAIKRFFTYNDLHFITSAYCKLWDGSKWIDADGEIVISNPDGFIVGFITNKINIYYSAFTNIDDRNEPKEFNYELSQNYPNPFNPSTTINYYIPATCFVTLKVYNILGEEIASLVNEEKSPGNHQVQFNAAGLASGIYIYRINAGAFTKSKLMILEK